MKLLHGTNSLGGGGAERQLRNLALGLGDKFETYIYSLGGGEHEQALREAKIHLTIKPLRREKLPLALIGLIRAIRQHRVDAVQSWDPQMDVLISVACRITGTRHIGSERNAAAQYSDPAGFGRAWYKKFRIPALIKSASVVVANSKAGKAYIDEATGGAVECRVIRNGMDFGEFDAGLSEVPTGVSQNPFLCISNRLSGMKRTRLGMRLFAAIASERPELRLRILGKGPEEEELRAYAAELGLADRIDFVGHQKNVASHVGRALVFITSSKVEGMPNSVLEAMALGVPVLASDIMPHRELAEECPAGLVLFDPENTEAGAAVLRDLLDNEDRRRKVSEAGRAYARSFTIPRMVGEYEKLYEELMKGKIGKARTKRA